MSKSNKILSIILFVLDGIFLASMAVYLPFVFSKLIVFNRVVLIFIIISFILNSAYALYLLCILKRKH